MAFEINGNPGPAQWRVSATAPARDMEITDEKRQQLRLPATTWIQYGEVDITREGDTLIVQGRGEDAYLKVLNHFGRVLKLYTHESGLWEDADTGGAPTGFDQSLAGRLPAARTFPQPAAKTKSKPAIGKPAKKKSATPKAAPKPAAKTAAKKTVAKKSAGKRPTARKPEGKKPAAKSAKTSSAAKGAPKKKP